MYVRVVVPPGPARHVPRPVAYLSCAATRRCIVPADATGRVPSNSTDGPAVVAATLSRWGDAGVHGATTRWRPGPAEEARTFAVTVVLQDGAPQGGTATADLVWRVDPAAGPALPGPSPAPTAPGGAPPAPGGPTPPPARGTEGTPPAPAPGTDVPRASASSPAAAPAGPPSTTSPVPSPLASPDASPSASPTPSSMPSPTGSAAAAGAGSSGSGGGGLTGGSAGPAGDERVVARPGPLTLPAAVLATALGVAVRSPFPLGLVAVVLLFLLVQDTIDRRDPKLALAPLREEPPERFRPTTPVGRTS